MDIIQVRVIKNLSPLKTRSETKGRNKIETRVQIRIRNNNFSFFFFPIINAD